MKLLIIFLSLCVFTTNVTAGCQNKNIAWWSIADWAVSFDTTGSAVSPACPASVEVMPSTKPYIVPNCQLVGDGTLLVTVHGKYQDRGKTCTASVNLKSGKSDCQESSNNVTDCPGWHGTHPGISIRSHAKQNVDIKYCTNIRTCSN